MSKYPTQIDSDAELPRVDDNLSETSVETINALREAVIAIEKAIGANPQGSTATLVQRLSVFFNDDGTAKASALVAAGLVALPVTNAMIASNAGIEESKLDLDVATQLLQNQIISNDIDIANLQGSMTALLAAYANHINGIADKHDGYAILLDKNYPVTTPPWLLGITATDVSTAIAAINNNFLDHTDLAAIGAHPASAISLDASTLQNVTATNLQDAIEQLDESRAIELVDHRDDMHANGLSLWANSTDGYSEHNQIIPQTVGATVSAYILPITRNIIDFSPLAMSTFPVQQGDSVVVLDTNSIGIYPINDIGPRNAVGTKPSLTANQVEIVGTFPDDGYVTARVYGSSSAVLLKGNLATTIHQSDFKVDSIQVSRPNAARIVSLGAQPQFLDSTGVLVVEVGVTASASRTIIIDNLHKDRNGTVVSPPTIDSLVERVNSVFQNRVDGYAFPATAYRVGDEFMLSHNWTDDFAYVRVTSAGNMNFYLGLDSNGANVEDRYVYPTANAYYYVNGIKLHDVAKITQQTASVSGQYISFTSFDPLAAGVKIGHLVHLKSHANTNEIGTYFITDVTSSVVKVHKNAGITAQASVNVEIYHDALPLDDFNTNVKDLVIETFVTSSGTLGYNERLSYEDNISNLKITDVSDNFAASSYTLESSISGSEVTLKFTNSYEKQVYIPTTFTGKLKIPSPHLIEYVIADITAPIGTGTSQFVFNPHINEEEVLELCSVRLDGLLTLSSIVDKRMFGTLGLDELREDVVQNYIEVPNQELRSNGVIEGLDIIAPDIDNSIPPYQDPTFPLSSNFYGLLVRGGTAMVGGVRVSVPITSVIFPNTAGTYIVGLNKLGTFKIFDTSQYSMADLLDGYADEVALIAQVDHDGTNIVDSSLIDLRFNISKIDDKIELLFDETNHFIGHFSSFKTALQYVNNYPKNEKFKIRVVAHGGGDIDITDVNHSLTVVIDGQVNNVTISGPCKITSESIASRAESHIRGTLTIQSGSNNVEISNLTIGNSNGASTSYLYVNDDGIYKFNNVIFNGASSGGQLQIVTPGSALADQVVFESCIFKDGTPLVIGSSGIIIDNFIINNCEMYGAGTGTKIDIPSNNLIISNTIFDNCGITQTFQLSKPAIINNCVFRNMTVVSGGKRVIDTVSTFFISNTKFDNIVASTADAIISSTTYDGYTRLQLDHCSFNNCTANVGYKLLESRGSITNSLFKSITCATAPGDLVVECTEFSGNSVLGQTNEFAVGAAQIERNVGLNVVKSASFASLQSVVGNTFLASSVFGYNINVASTAGIEISSNIFSMGPQTAIQIDSGTGDIAIFGNEFNHTGYCINSSITSMGISFINNIVKSPSLLAGPGTGNMETVFSGNIFENASGTTLNSAASRIIFESNIVLTGPLTINASSTSALNISNNLFTSNLVITSDLIGSSISNNVFNTGTIDISGNISYSTISNNVDGGGIDNFVTLQLGAALVSHTLITNNTISLSGIASAILSDTMITDNIIGGTSITLNIDPSTAADDYAHVIFSDNLLDDDIDITLSSSGAIRGVIIDGNIASTSIHPTYPTLTASVVLNESIISSNYNFNISISAGMNSCNITDNISLNSTLSIAQSCNSNIVSGNYVSNLVFSGTSASGMLLSNMYINQNTTISAVAGNIDKMSFINNVTSGTFAATSTSGNFTRFSINGNIIGGTSTLNITGTDISLISNIILASTTIWSTTGSYSLSRANISNNIVTGDLSVCSTLTSGTSSFADSRIGGNVISGNLNIMTAVTSGATMSFNNNIISDNSCVNIDVFANSNSLARGAITFQQNSILNNRLTGDIVFRPLMSTTQPGLTANASQPAPAANVIINKAMLSGNTFNALSYGRWLDYNNFSISSNRLNDTAVSIAFDIDPVAATGTLDSLNITNNLLSADIIMDIRSGTAISINRLMMSGNIMPNSDFIARFYSSSSSLITASFVSWVIQSNIMRAISMNGGTGSNASSVLDIYYCNISNNGFGGDTAAVAGTSYEPGIYIMRGSKTPSSSIALLSIFNNFANPDGTTVPRTQILLDSTAGGGTWNISELDISSNKGMDIIIDDDSVFSFNRVTIKSNVFKNDTAPTERGIRRIGSSTTSTFSELAIEGNIGGQVDLGDIGSLQYSIVANNSMPSGLHISLDSISTINKLAVFNNVSLGTSNLDMSNTTSASSVLINGNQLSAVTLSNYSTATAISIGGNQLSTLNLSSTNSFAALTRLGLTNNYFSSAATISSAAAPLFTIDDSTISGNVFAGNLNIIVQNLATAATAGIDSLTFNGNQCDGTVDFGDTANIDDMEIVGNRIETLNLRSVTQALTDVNISMNVFSNLYLATNSIWQATNTRNGTTGRSTIIGNRISTAIESSGAGFDTGTVLARCFVWGNTGNNPVLVTASGVTARTLSNTNNFSGGITTP